jgi:hypothetical protein
MKRGLVQVLKVVLVAAGSAPVAVLLTWLLLPLWDQLEASTGIESRGHSGPSGWCYVAVYSLLVVASLSLLFRPRARTAT